MLLTDSDWQALWLTLQLAGISTALLMLLGLPLAAWRVRKQTRLRQVLDAVPVSYTHLTLPTIYSV